MCRVVRACLLWVMVIAMPVQGMAASLMAFCGPSHERMLHGLMSERAIQPASHSHHAAHGATAKDHGAHGQSASIDPDADLPLSLDSDGARYAASHQESPHHGKFSCSACAVCCTALALPVQASIPPLPDLAHPLGLSPLVPIVSHPPDGLDRPPRTVLA